MARERLPFNIGRSQDFQQDQLKLLEIGGRQIGIIRLRTGELRAVLNRCPHKGAPICKGTIGGVWNAPGPGELSFDSSRQILVCPWHGFAFDLDTGEEVFWPSAARLRMYRIEEVDGIVSVVM